MSVAVKVDTEYERPDSVSSGNPEYEGEVDENGVEIPKVGDSKYSKYGWMAFYALIVAGLMAFTIVALVKDAQRAKPLFAYWGFALLFVLMKLVDKYGKDQTDKLQESVGGIFEQISGNKVVSIIISVVTLGLIALVIGLSVDSVDRLISLAGLVFLVVFTWITSFKPRQVKWRPVLGGLLFQFVFGFLIMRTTAGVNLFSFFGDNVTVLLDYTKAGSNFVFGYLGNFNGFVTNTFGQDIGLFPVFAFNVLPTVVFFSAVVSILYHVGILQVIIRVLGRILAVLLGTSASESLNAAGNIFVGQTEAPLLIRPFLKEMTESEIHAVMTGGFATIAGGVLAIYISFGISTVHLLSASVMSAPAALAFSKLAYPETEVSKTRAGVKYVIETPDNVNIIEAAANGATVAIQLAINIGGQLIAFLGLIAMLNAFLGYFGNMVDEPELSFEMITGWIFYPLARIMGADLDDAEKVATLIGTKVFVNEFVAYEMLRDVQAGAANAFADKMSLRSEIIATYALCGFANFGSIGIVLGGLTPIAPNKAKVIAKLVFWAMIVGNIACFATACIAGLLYDESRGL